MMIKSDLKSKRAKRFFSRLLSESRSHKTLRAEREERERLQEPEAARVALMESVAGRWEEARRLEVFIGAVGAEGMARE